MNIELPKDADGQEIPLDTEVLYDRYGFKNFVKSFMYVIRTDTCTGIWRVKFITGTSLFAVSDMHLAEPDSWEKLDEDLHAVEVCGDSPDLEDPVCAYARNIGKKCAECKLYAGDCTVNMCKDIVSRINKLRGEGK
jgi:hypothetical protein